MEINNRSKTSKGNYLLHRILKTDTLLTKKLKYPTLVNINIKEDKVV